MGAFGEGGAEAAGVTARAANRGRSSGTGSSPPALNGWQRQILSIPNVPPAKGPCRKIDRRVYSEQLGSNRQAGPSIGEMPNW